MTFSVLHIVLTAVLTGVVALVVGFLRLPRERWLDTIAAAVLVGAAVALWRLSANMPQLNEDGLPGFSANDWAAPAMTYLFLSGYADMRPPLLDRRYRQFRILATLGALAVNVITI
jgi:hypothetical protein